MGQGGHSPEQGAEASIVWSRGHPWSARLSPAAGASKKGELEKEPRGRWVAGGWGWGRAGRVCGIGAGRAELPIGPAWSAQRELPEARFALDRCREGLGQGPVMCELKATQGCPQRAGTRSFCCHIHSSLPRGELAGCPGGHRSLQMVWEWSPQPPLLRGPCFSWHLRLPVSLLWAVKMFASFQVQMEIRWNKVP